MESRPCTSHQLTPGFRFHPSDEELIIYYLRNKVSSRKIPGSIIGEIDLYKYYPWELPEKAPFGEHVWYFFTSRNRKYPNGERPNRAAASGYWKATGIDRTIMTSNGSQNIGVKKSLVFYIGQSPKGVKTDWLMNEYRLPDKIIRPSRSNGTMRNQENWPSSYLLVQLDDWVLCRVRKRGRNQKHFYEYDCSLGTEPTINLQAFEEAQPANTDKKDSIFIKHIYKDCPVLASLLSGQPLAQVESILSTRNNHTTTAIRYSKMVMFQMISLQQFPSPTVLPQLKGHTKLEPCMEMYFHPRKLPIETSYVHMIYWMISMHVSEGWD